MNRHLAQSQDWQGLSPNTCFPIKAAAGREQWPRPSKTFTGNPVVYAQWPETLVPTFPGYEMAAGDTTTCSTPCDDVL